MNKEFGKLEEITDLRDYWKNEATDFTPWLAKEENISLLSEAIGIDITVEERESNVGDFNVDIYASETETDRKIIIENQLEATDHDHLGKLTTYASGKEANIIIWIVKEAREEHRAAIEWLNNHTDKEIGFFLCEIKIYKIENSKPAVKFEVIQRPNEWTKEIKNMDLNPTEQLRHEYWTAYNDYAFKDAQSEYAKNFGKRKPSKSPSMGLRIGISNCNIEVWQTRKYNSIKIELRIYDNEEIFDNLFNYKENIENEAGLQFDWQKLPKNNEKISRVIIQKEVDFDNKEKWDEQFDWIMETAIKMKKTFTKYI